MTILDFKCFRYIVTFLMIWHLNKRAVLLPPKLRELQFGGYVKSGEYLFELSLVWLYDIGVHLTDAIYAVTVLLCFCASITY